MSVLGALEGSREETREESGIGKDPLAWAERRPSLVGPQAPPPPLPPGLSQESILVQARVAPPENHLLASSGGLPDAVARLFPTAASDATEPLSLQQPSIGLGQGLVRKAGGQAGQAEQSRAGQGSARQGRTGHGRAGQGRAGQGRADKAGQDRDGRAGQGRAGQSRAGQGRARQNRTGQGRHVAGGRARDRAQGAGQGQPSENIYPTLATDRIIHAIDGLRKAQDEDKTGTKGQVSSIKEGEKLHIWPEDVVSSRLNSAKVSTGRSSFTASNGPTCMLNMSSV